MPTSRSLIRDRNEHKEGNQHVNGGELSLLEKSCTAIKINKYPFQRVF